MALNEDRYQKIRVRMWRGETVPQLSRDAKLLWVYLLSSPDTTMIPGLLSVGVGSIADDLGYSFDEVRAALAEIEATGEVHFDPAGLVWFRKALQHNPPDAPNNVKGWRRHWSEVRTCALKDVAWTEIRSWLAEYRGQTFVQSFDAACPRPVLSKNPQNRTPSPTPSGTPFATGSATPSGTPSRTQEQYQEQKQKQNPGESACAGAPAPAHTFDKSPQTSPSGRVVAEVVSTEAPPSRLPPVPVEVAPSAVPATVPPSSHATGPLAASAAEDDDQPPPAQRCPSTPRPGPVVAVAPAAPVEAAPAVTPAPLPVAASPSGQTALLPDLAPVPVPAEDAPPVAIPRVADLDDRTPANRVLRAWGATCYRAHQQPLATEARRRVVRDRLRVFSEADLIRAITGAMADPYVNGQSDRAPSGGQRDIAWLFAKVERVEGFLRAAAPPPAPPPSPRLTPRMPPPPKPGQVRPLISVEDYERNAFAPVLPRRMSPADLAAFDQGGAHVG